MTQEATNNNTNNWNNDPIEENHPHQAQRQSIIEPPQSRPSLSLQLTPPPPQLPETEFEKHYLDQANIFFNRYKRAITAMGNRRELQQLYDDTFSSWSNPGDDQNFSRVLFAMARGLKAVRVIPGGTLLWNDRRNEHRHDERQRHDERRSQNDDDGFYDRFQFQTRDHRQPPHDHDRHGRERFQPRDRQHHERERFQPRDDRQHHERARFQPRDDMRQERRQETNLAEIVENQQKMIETLMAKVMN